MNSDLQQKNGLTIDLENNGSWISKDYNIMYMI